MKKNMIANNRVHEYPDTIYLSQMYKICKISKRTASRLLTCGLIPSVNTGKKTHTFKIAKADVINYLDLRKQEPERFIAPKGYMANRKNIIKKKIFLPDEADAIRDQFGKLLNTYPDVMTVSDISKFTGYAISSVVMWCKKDRLRYFDMGNHYLIPKPYLLDYIMGPYFGGMKEKQVE